MLKALERGPAIGLIDGQFAVQHEVAAHGADGRDDLGERAVQEVALPRDQFDLRTALPGQAAKSVVFEQAPIVVLPFKNKTRPNNVRQLWCDKPRVGSEGHFRVFLGL